MERDEHGKNEVFGGKVPPPLYPPQLPHGLACGEYSPPSASRAGGTYCVLLPQLLEELNCLHLHHLPAELQCIHLHHLPEELASICITYRRNLPPSASPTGGPLNASIYITYGRNLLHLHNVSEELTISICITYWRNLNAFI
jgi:hypothetical protein